VGRSKIVLFGFMASGKTTIGGLLSEMTGMRLLDTDVMVEEVAGATVEEVFAAGGEERFRELERTEVLRAAGRQNVIIAVGGGAVLEPGNVVELRRAGVMYLLDVSADEVRRRAHRSGGRPLLGGGKGDVEELMRARRGVYREAADVVIETTGRKPSEVAGEIAADFRSRSPGRTDGS